MNVEAELLKLAMERFTNLSPAEEKLFRSAAKGEPANFNVASDEENDPNHADKWPAERVLNADRIAWLCTDSAASKLVTNRGIIVTGAQINETLNLEWAKITFPLVMQKCAFSGSIVLNRSNLNGLYLIDTHINDLQADEARIGESVYLRNVKAEGEVRLPGATIASNLECSGGQFNNAKAIALYADRAKIGGAVFFRNGFKAEGEVRLLGANIALNLECDGGQFTNANAVALNADGVKIGGAVFLRNGFKAEGEVRLLGATIALNLECDGGQFTNANAVALNADGVKIGGAVYLRNVKAEGGVRLPAATIALNLECDGGQFTNANAVALNAEGVKIRGAIYLRDVKAEGEVQLLGATASNLLCHGGQFNNAKAVALTADGVKIEGSIFLRDGFKAAGEVRLLGATIASNLECDGGQFTNANAVALNADGVKIGGAVFLRDRFQSEGEVRLVGATASNLVCDSGQFTNANAVALNADGVKIGGAVFLRNVKAEGGVLLLGATIALNLECDGGQFTNANAVALNAEGVKIGGSVFLRNGFKSAGEVRLLVATIASNLECDGGQFNNAKAIAITADGVKIEGSVFLRNGFKAEGEVRLPGATIASNLECSGGQFNNAKADSFALQADGIKINGSILLRDGFEVNGKLSFISAYVAKHFQWLNVQMPEKIILDLRSAKVGTFWDEEKSWPKIGNLFLNGFVYDEIQHSAPTDAKSRINWLKRQPASQFLPQPYEQLAGVLRKMGHENEANKVMIEKNDDIAHRFAFFQPGRWLQFFFKLFVGYGYRPWRAFGWSLAVIIIGTLLFSSGNRAGIITPTKENAYVSSSDGTLRLSEDYPKFNSFIYSLEMFTPLLKLEMGNYWQPNANRSGQYVVQGILLPINGSLLRGYLWCHIILGWVLTTLWVGGLTGLVKK